MTGFRGDRAAARAALAGDPLPGGAGYAGELDGALIRDPLGRVPLFRDDGRAAFDPAALDDPAPVPAGELRRDGAVETLSLPDPEPLGERAAVEGLREALRGAVAAVEGDPAVALSGGVDSTLAALASDGPCYVVGRPDSADVRAAREAARLLDRDGDLRVVTAERADVERAATAVGDALGPLDPDPVDVSVAVALCLVAERAAADGADRLVVGQGADELFGGYEKVAEAAGDERLTADTVRGARDEVLASLPDQLARDGVVLRDAGVEPVVALLRDDVVAAALRLPASLLSGGRVGRKAGLRLAVRPFLPDRIAFRRKRAVQYGSGVGRLLDSLAREAGHDGPARIARYVA
jgi:asparagine synthase (glutamine-hydrolysing)